MCGKELTGHAGEMGQLRLMLRPPCQHAVIGLKAEGRQAHVGIEIVCGRRHKEVSVHISTLVHITIILDHTDDAHMQRCT